MASPSSSLSSSSSSSSRPDGIDPDFDCKMKRLAYEFAHSLLLLNSDDVVDDDDYYYETNINNNNVNNNNNNANNNNDKKKKDDESNVIRFNNAKLRSNLFNNVKKGVLEDDDDEGTTTTTTTRKRGSRTRTSELSSIFDALELNSLCNVPHPPYYYHRSRIRRSSTSRSRSSRSGGNNSEKKKNNNKDTASTSTAFASSSSSSLSLPKSEEEEEKKTFSTSSSSSLSSSWWKPKSLLWMEKKKTNGTSTKNYYSSVYDSVGKSSIGGKSRSSTVARSSSVSTTCGAIFVDAKNGSDSTNNNNKNNNNNNNNVLLSGTIDSPFQTIHYALQFARKVNANTANVVNNKEGGNFVRCCDNNNSRRKRTIDTIYLLSNAIHYINSTIHLNEVDSGLTISGYYYDSHNNNSNENNQQQKNKRATISAAVPLTNLKWKRYYGDGGGDPSKHIFVTKLPKLLNLTDVPGVHLVRSSRNRYGDNDDDDSSDDDENNNDENGRLIVARYPNVNNPYIMNEQYNGDPRISQGKAIFLPPKIYKESDYKYITINNPKRNDTADNWFTQYKVGIGGSCSIYNPPVSYWCSNETQGGGAFQFRVPSGIMLNDTTILPNLHNYTLDGIKQAVFNVWRPYRWSNWMFEGLYNKTTQKFVFNNGGYQGARGHDEGGDWFIENVFEELDSPNEFYYSRKFGLLYVCLNSTAANETHPNNLGLLTVPKLEEIFHIEGSSCNDNELASNITLTNLILTGTRHTYLTAPHSPPSGGDWSLERRGSIFLENTKHVQITNSLLHKLDGHGIMISGKNLHTTISDNEIRFVGGSGIASWGRTDGEINNNKGFTAFHKLYPVGNVILRNVIHEIGHYEKQNSFYMQAKTCNSVISHNIFFNGPRAGINFNDGFTGGDIITKNLIFNACRESGDHGPFNSWDRQPYLTPTINMKWRNITHNFLIANYQSQEGIDTDDGSAYYNVVQNFIVYGQHGLKSDFGGHDIHHYNNVYAFVEQSCFWDTYSKQILQHEDYFQFNKCIFRSHSNDNGQRQNQEQQYAEFDTSGSWPHLGYNELYIKGGGGNNNTESNSSSVSLKINDYDIKEFQKKFPGVDDYTRVYNIVTHDVIMDWARQVLMLKKPYYYYYNDNDVPLNAEM